MTDSSNRPPEDVPKALPLDPVTHKKLHLAKQLYQDAVVQMQSGGTALRRVLAVLHLDLAIETSLRAATVCLDPQRVPKGDFQSLVQQTDVLLERFGLPAIPDRAKIQIVHTTRNDAQHKVRVPSQDSVSDCRTYTRDFLQQFVAGVWSADFAELSASQLVQHEATRSLLSDAERHLAAGEYLNAIRCAAEALDTAMASVRTVVVGKIPSSVDSIVVEGMSFQIMRALGGSNNDGRATLRAVRTMQDTLLFAALGLDQQAWWRHFRIAGRLVRYVDGSIVYEHGMADPDASDAEFVVAFCCRTVLQIEDGVGDLGNPFGSEQT